MTEYIAFDSHQHYTLAEREDAATGRTRQRRIDHRRGAIAAYAQRCPPGTPVAVEATGNWYWIIDEIEQAGLEPRLVHPRKAKLMMGMINKTDRLDVHGLNRLQRAGTLPTVWIPPGHLRDLREVTRTRMVLVAARTRAKNRLTAPRTKYALNLVGVSDAYGPRSRSCLEAAIDALPTETCWTSRLLLQQIDLLTDQIKQVDARLEALITVTPEMERLMTLPGVGVILAAVIALEVGCIDRFPSAEHLAAYAGTTPRVHASGGKVRYGPLRPDVNRYLKWAFVEAGNSVALNHRRRPGRHVSRRYRQVRRRKGHATAVGAVARHLAEATYHVWSRAEPYRDPDVGRTRKA